MERKNIELSKEEYSNGSANRQEDQGQLREAHEHGQDYQSPHKSALSKGKRHMELPSLADCQECDDEMVSKLLCYLPISQYFGVDMK